MNYETKILLNKLVEFITDPAWWSVIATFVAAAVAAVITWIFGKRQENLQKKLLQLEKFNAQQEIHRNLYLLSLESRVVLPLIYEYFIVGSSELLLSRFDKYNTDFERLARKIEMSEADYLLRFGENKNIVDARCLADAISFIFGKVASIQIEPRKDVVSVFERIQARNNNWSDKEWLENIKKKWPDDDLISILEFFIKEKQRLFEGENSVLDDIRKTCIDR